MKQYIIKQQGDEWILFDHTGKKVLGRHKSKESALAQERAIQARKGMFEELDVPYDDLMLVHAFEEDLQTINDVDVFAVGTWRGVNSPPEGDTYTEGDLDNMIDAFNEGIMAPNIKITHGADKEQVDIGKVANLRRIGKKLFADFVDVPKALYELMKKGLFKTRSSEVVWNLKHEGKTWPRVLKAVALLAPGQKPAVGALSEGYQFEALYCYEVPRIYKGNIQAIVNKWRKWAGPASGDYNHCVSILSGKAGITNPKAVCAWMHKRATGATPGEDHMEGYEPEPDELRSVEIAVGAILSYQEIQEQEKIRRSEMTLEDLMKKYNCKDEAELEALLENEKEAKKRLQEYEKNQKEAAMNNIKSFMGKMKEEGKILPKEEADILKNFEILMERGDTERVESLKTYISSQQKRVEMGEKARHEGNLKTYDETKPAEDEVDRLAHEYMSQGKAKDYNAALLAVKADHKELWEKYASKR